MKNSSEESNETSEEMNHAHVENKKYPRGNFEISTWKSVSPDTAPYRYVVGSKLL